MKKPLSDRIRGHQPDWDKEAFWSQLEPELPRRNSRRFVFWWWFGASLLLLAVAWGTYTWGNATTISALPIPLPLAERVSPPAPAQDGLSLDEATRKIQQQGVSSLPSSSEVKLYVDEETLKAKPTKQAPPYAPAEDHTRTNNITNQRVQTTTATPTLTVARSLQQLPTLPLPPLQHRSALQKITQQQETINKGGTSRWYHSFQFGPAYANRSYQTEDADLSLLQERQGQIRESLMLEYFLGWQHPSGWFAQLGLAFQQRRELLEWEGVVDSVKTRQSIDNAYTYTDQSGQTLYQSGEVEVTALTRRRIVQQNYFYTLDIPATVGYQYERGRWAWQAQAGFRINILHVFHGKWVTTTNQVLESEAVNANLVPPSLGTAWSLGTGVAYKIRPQAELFGLARYQRFRVKVSRPPSYDITYQQWGLLFGLRQYF